MSQLLSAGFAHARAVKQRLALPSGPASNGRVRDEAETRRRRRAVGDVNMVQTLIPRSFSLAEAGFGRLIAALEGLLTEHPGDEALEGRETWVTD